MGKFNLNFMSAEVFDSAQLSYLFMVSSATGLWVGGLPNGRWGGSDEGRGRRLYVGISKQEMTQLVTGWLEIIVDGIDR
jgi:hypothetical protein